MNLLKKCSAIFVFGLVAIANANAGVIIGQLYNTGLDASGPVVTLDNGGIDGNWDVPAGTDAVTYFNNAYLANDANSKWISSKSDGANETTVRTDYEFVTTFDLTGYNASTANIMGSWGVDNYATIWLNGSDTGISLDFGTSSFNTLTSFSISDFFVSGINTLMVKVTNGYDTDPAREPGPMALRFDNMSLTADVPAPGTFALLGIALAGLGFSRRAKR